MIDEFQAILVWDFEVRWREIDMASIAFYPNIFIWFGEATCKVIEELTGMDIPEMIEAGVAFPCVAASSRFLSPVRYKDQIRLLVLIDEVKGSKMTVRFLAYRKDDEVLLVEGVSVHAWSKISEGGILKAAELPAYVLARAKELQGKVSAR